MLPLDKQALVPIAYRAPFAIGATPWCDQRQHGETILEMVRSVPNLPRSFLAKGIVCVNGEVVPRELWSYVRPKPVTDNLPIAVTLHWPLGNPGGGGGGTLKSVIGIVAAIALIVVTYGIASGAIFGTLGTIAFGITGAQVLAAAVGIAGALAISALTAPPTQDAQPVAGGTVDSNTDSREAASASGNVLAPGGSIPRVIGTRKIFPPFICEPVVELIEKDEFVEAVLALNGPHLLEDIRIDGVSLTDAEDVEFETREGWPDDDPITLVQRQGRTITPQITLSTHALKPDSFSLLHDSDPTHDLPVWHGTTTRNDPDKVWLHLLFPGGISPATSARLSVPFRMRMRLRGDSEWVNFPEFHIAGSNVEQLRLAIVLKWLTASQIPSIESVDTWEDGDPPAWYFSISVPPQITDPPSASGPGTWNAANYFVNGSGSFDYYYTAADLENTTRVKNFNTFIDRVEFYLDRTIFTPGVYEIEIKRGAPYLQASFSTSDYKYAGVLKDFFWYADSSFPRIPQTRTNYSDRCALVRVVTIWDEHPVQTTGFALIALKARNRQISRISVDGSGYVRNWDGSAWTIWETTSNPAPHYVDILSGSQNLDPLPSDLRDDTGLLVWRALCDTNDWSCDAIIDDMRTQDALNLVASCAYAKPYQSDQYGITLDNDHSLDVPIQVFSRMNANNVKFEKAFARVPEGFIVTFRDEASDDDRAQTVVYQRDRSISTTGLLESITYEGLIEQPKVEARALFDLDQANQRSTFYSLDTDIESIVCRRGSLVALQHDMLSSRAGDAHIKTKTIGGPNITGFVLDSVIPVTTNLDMHALADMHLVTDMHEVGILTGIAIRRTDGTISTHQLSNVSGETNTITLTTPITDTATILGFDNTDDEYGCLVVAGALASEYRRMLVLSIAPTKDLKASMVLVDEAPDLVRYARLPLVQSAQFRPRGTGTVSAYANLQTFMQARFNGNGIMLPNASKLGVQNADIRFGGIGNLSVPVTLTGLARATFSGAGNLRNATTGIGNDSFTKILLHFNGFGGNTNIDDENAGGSAHTWTAGGNAQLDDEIVKFGSASCLFDGTGDYADTPDHSDFTLGSGDWTVDFWFQPNTAGNGTTRYLFAQCNSSGADWTIGANLTNANKVLFILGDASGVASSIVIGTTAFTTATWNHFEACRTGNTVKMFLNGVQEGGDLSYSITMINSTSKFAVGRAGEGTTNTWRGNIDEFRLSVGIARHTSNFTPPTAPYG